MTRYAAFLRAINIGGRRVKMDVLRGHFERLGFRDVATHIASGNVIFDAPLAPDALVRRIEDGLRDALGWDVATFVRSGPELDAILGRAPFGADAGDPFIGFLRRAPTPAEAAALGALETAADGLRVVEREVHWLRRSRTDSAISYARVEKALGQAATFRGQATVDAIAARFFPR